MQKYLHDLAAWEELSTEEQEKVIGRRKLTDIEPPEDEKPSNSHIALNDIEDEDGNDREILRDNMPFGSLRSGEFGTYFIGYAPATTTASSTSRRRSPGACTTCRRGPSSRTGRAKGSPPHGQDAAPMVR